jgi:hypothetical protein
VMHAEKYLSYTNYQQICNYVLENRNKKDVLVRKTVIQIFPFIAQFKLKNFMSDGFYKKVIDYLLNIIHNKNEIKGHAFFSISKISTFMDMVTFRPYSKQLI